MPRGVPLIVLSSLAFIGILLFGFGSWTTFSLSHEPRGKDAHLFSYVNANNGDYLIGVGKGDITG